MSAQVVTLQSSATQTATSQSASKPLNTITMAQVELDITAVDTVTDFTAFLQGSNNGTDWFDLVADQVMKHSGGQTAGASATDDRDICDAETAVSKHVAIYKHLAAKYVRIAWYLNGTSVTFSAKLVGK